MANGVVDQVGQALQRLVKLKSVTANAEILAEKIRKLKAVPRQPADLILRNHSTGQPYLPEDLLYQVFRTGLDATIEELENEMITLLNGAEL